MSGQDALRARATQQAWYRSSNLAEVRQDSRSTVLDLSRTDQPSGPTPYVLNGSALEIWRLLDVPRTVDDITAEVAHRVGAEPSALVADIARFVEELAELRLICSAVSDGGRATTTPSQEQP